MATVLRYTLSQSLRQFVVVLRFSLNLVVAYHLASEDSFKPSSGGNGRVHAMILQVVRPQSGGSLYISYDCLNTFRID